ncbi:MAG: hypothetical protein DRI32_09585 [Chloroflexi bacterium]|nr:MAG: hypothetical protein DRI32_09585 [Chloroflexota bacterium]
MKQNNPLQVDEKKVIAICENCYQKLRIPKRNKKLQVTCTRCQHKFEYRYYGLGLSSSSKKPFLVGFLGSLLGFFIIEVLVTIQFLLELNQLILSTIVFGVFGMSLGMSLGAADGYIQKDKKLFCVGLKKGAYKGVVSGMIAGFFSQLIFSGILLYLSPNPYIYLWTPTENLPLLKSMLARSIGFGTFALLIGLFFSLKKANVIQIKPKLIVTGIAGIVTGLLFDPFYALIFRNVCGVRFLGFSIIGVVVGLVFYTPSKIRWPFKKSATKHTAKRRQGNISSSFSKTQESIDEMLIVILGLVLLIGGYFLVAGNRTGVFPTFPFAGFITSSIGLVILSKLFSSN